MFLAETTKPFERFSRIFQKAEPVVHILYVECRNLVTLLISKICTSDTVKNFDSINDPFAAESLKLVDSLRFRDEIEKLLKSQCESKSLSEKDVLLFRQSAQKHYIAAVKHILEKSILQWKEAKHLRFLQPNYIPKEGSARSAMIINRALPLEIAEADLHDVWTLLRIDNLPKYSSGERIDHYWAKIFEIENGSGEAKYPLVAKLVKATLSLVHGSADVERRFSDSGNQLTEDRASMSERTFNARMTVKDALKRFNNQPQLVMITIELICMGSSACSAYKAHLECEEETRKRKAEEKKSEEEEAEIQRKMLAEQEKKKEDLKKLEERLKEAKKEEKDCKDARESLIDEAIKKLDAAVKKKDLTGVKVAEGLLRGAQSLKTGSNNPEVEKLDKEVSKRKSSLISGLIATKCRSDNGNQSHKK